MSNVSNGVTSNPVSPLLNNQSSETAAEVQRDGVDEEEWVSRAEDDVPPPEPDLQCKPCEVECGVRTVRFKRGPKDLTEDERKEHDACHVPFRSWCSHCVSAAANASTHQRDGDEESDAVPHHHVPCWFMLDCKGAEIVPVLVIRQRLQSLRCT